MANWVIDENVFEECSRPGISKFEDAFYLIETIYRFHRIVLDHENLILTKYRKFFDGNKLLEKWFAKLRWQPGHVEYRSSRLTQAVEATLDTLGFDQDDKPFVGVALNSDRLVVTENGDFRDPPAGDYIREQLQIEALTIEKANETESARR